MIKPTTINNYFLAESGNIFIMNEEHDISALNGKGNVIVGTNKIDPDEYHNVVIIDTHILVIWCYIFCYKSKISGAHTLVTGGA